MIRFPSTDKYPKHWKANCRLFAAALMLAIGLLPASGQAPTTRLVQVEWPNPQDGKSNLQAILGKKRGPGIQIVAAELATVKFPVLVPEQLFDFASLIVGAIGANQYYANARTSGLLVVVGGSRIVHDFPDQSPSANSSAALAANQYRVSRTETGFRLTLTRYGAPYSISTECRQTDRRCTEPYIRSLADRMIFIGGEP